MSLSSLPIKPAMIVTLDHLPGYRIVECLGVSEGVAVNVFPGVMWAAEAAMVFDAMREAFLDMLHRAAAQGANAIVGLRYAVPSSEDRLVIAYGTAVKVVKDF